MKEARMTTARWWIGGIVGALCLAGCGRSAPPKPPDTSWVAGVKPWYCGAAPGDAAPDAPKAVALRLAHTADAVTGTYGILLPTDRTVGTLSHFKPVADRAATLTWKDDQKRKGEAQLTFSPDFATATLTWNEAAPALARSATLTASDTSVCLAASLIR
jgi:hypothetical protein